MMVAVAANAQKITGTVKGDEGKPLNAATVTLVRAKDSATVKFTTTAKDGSYHFENFAGDSYYVAVTNSGYKSNRTAIVAAGADEVKVPEIAMAKLPSDLAAVTVTSTKPVVEVKADKLIVNVEGTINATGNDGLELLRKSPGVIIDKDDNITLAGKNGVQIFIDGKPSPLSGTDLSNYLKSLQASQIESIELITNPSAKYEAAGNAGIINFKLKKNKSFGTNGSVSAGYNISKFAKYNTGFTLNNRNKHANVFGNYNFSESLNQSTFVLDRNQGDTFFHQTNTLKSYNHGTHNFKAGADFFINDKSTFGAVINGNISDNTVTTSGPLNFIYVPTNTLTKILNATGDNENKRRNVNFNLNYRYATKTGKELNVDADYGFFKIRGNQLQPNDYTDLITNAKYSNVYHMISPTDIDIYSVKVDYEQNAGKGKIGFGGKFGYVSTKNDFSRYNVYGSTEVYDKDKSNLFDYKENINALYVNYNRSFKGMALQIGLRGEATDSKGKSTGLKYNSLSANYDSYDSSIHRNYADLFPSAAVTFNKNPKSQFGVTFSRRIDRPAYQDLNPFEFKINDYTFMKGNTALRPQYTNSFGLTHTYMYKLTTQLNYSHVKDIFTQLPDTTERSKSFLTKKNLATQDIVSLNISYPFMYKKYTLFTNVNSYYSKYQADYGGKDRKIDLDVVAVNIFVQNTYKFGKGYTAELSGFFNSPTIWQGVFKSISMYSVDGGMQKTILKGKGTVKMSVSDIFHTMKFKGTSSFAGQTSTASGRWESRQFKVNFTYRFGSNTVKAARQRKDAVEEERKRTQAAGGFGGQ